MVGARKVLVEGRGDGECPSDEGAAGNLCHRMFLVPFRIF